MNVRVETLAQLAVVSEILLDHIKRGYTLFLLTGDLGTGKTTLIKEICARLDVLEPVGSPTFSLINAYDSPGGGLIYHMDFYRLEKPSDLVQIGLEEYLDSGHLCFIEWPELAAEYFFPPYVQIAIELDTNNIRNFNITTYDAMDT